MSPCRAKGQAVEQMTRVETTAPTRRPRGAWDAARWVTDNDRERSRTSHGLGDLRRALDAAPPEPVTRFLDVGCGYGGLSRLVGEYLGAEEVHGVDIDDRVVPEAVSKGVEVTLQDASAGPLPFEDGSFDGVMTLGMMDYLVSFDGIVRELNRVISDSGWLLVTLPNLASWHNRLALLMGYQPRDVEISSEILAGVAPGYAGEPPAGHIHIPTVKAFTELMTHHGFETVALLGGRPRMNPTHPLLAGVDRVLSHRPSLARRFYYVGRKVSRPAAHERTVDMPYQSLD
jgi:SAM-dependent methyltransferase